WSRWFAAGTDAPPPPPEPRPASGLKRVAAVLVAAARELAGQTLTYCLVGLAGVGLVSALLPYGCLQTAMNHGDPRAPLLMAGVALPVYAGPMKVMMQLGLMFEHGNSVGAACALLVLGAGLNLGLVAWAGHSYGWRRTLAWLALVVAVTLALPSPPRYPPYPRPT